jgi:hypothetical protein
MLEGSRRTVKAFEQEVMPSCLCKYGKSVRFPLQIESLEDGDYPFSWRRTSRAYRAQECVQRRQRHDAFSES